VLVTLYPGMFTIEESISSFLLFTGSKDGGRLDTAPTSRPTCAGRGFVVPVALLVAVKHDWSG